MFRSAGVAASLRAEAVDPRAQAVLLQRGYPASKDRSRRLGQADFLRHDLVVAMDHAVLAELQRQCPDAQRHKLRLLMDFTADCQGQDIPDPYYGDQKGFERVLELCEKGVRGLLQSLPGAVAQG